MKRARSRSDRHGLALACLVLTMGTASLPAGARSVAAQETPRTGAERFDWSRATTHREVMEFLAEIQARSDRIVVRTIGQTVQGRPLPVVFLGDSPLASRGASATSEKPTILILGSIHGDEPSGREGALQLIRSVTVGAKRDLLDSVDIILVPNTNPDGATANTRRNADGYDLNRDWIVAETPEVGAILDEILTEYRPDVFVDVHNGGAFPYHLTYQTTLDPAADPDLVALARGPIFRHVQRRLESQEMSMYWYSGPSFDSDEDRWYWRTTEPWPRKQHSYGGLQNMVTLLLEIPERHPLEVGANVAAEAMASLVRFVAEHPDEVKGVVREARRRTLEEPLEDVHLELESTPYPEAETFLVVPSRADRDGDEPRPTGAEVRLVEGENRTRFRASRSRPAPWGYVLDARLEAVVRLLRRHGVRVEELNEEATVAVERFRLLDVTRAAQPYQNHHLLDVEVELDPGTATLSRGAFLVRVRQPAGRLIPQLLEPDAVDSLVRWNLFDAVLPRPGGAASHLPLYRLSESPPVSTTLLP